MKIKKFVPAILVAAMLMSLAVVFTGCYNINPAPREDIFGTYELTTYNRTYPIREGEEEVERINFITEYAAKSYIVIREDGYGYYFYTDKDTPLVAKEIKITLEESTSEDEVGRISYVKYDFDGKNGDTLGVNRKKFGKIVLNYTGKPVGFRFVKENDRITTTKDYSETVKYKKISKQTDLKTVKNKFKNIPPIAKYEMNPYDGNLFEFCAYENERTACPLVYFACLIDGKQMTAEVWYGTKGEGSEVIDNHKTDVAVTALYDDYNVLDGFKIGEYTFKKQYESLSLRDGEQKFGRVVVVSYDEENFNAYILTEKQNYNALFTTEDAE